MTRGQKNGGDARQTLHTPSLTAVKSPPLPQTLKPFRGEGLGAICILSF